MAEEKQSPCLSVSEAREKVVKLEVLVAMALENDEKMLKLLESLQASDARIEDRLNKRDEERAKIVGGVTVLIAVGSIVVWVLDKVASKIGYP